MPKKDSRPYVPLQKPLCVVFAVVVVDVVLVNVGVVMLVIVVVVFVM